MHPDSPPQTAPSPGRRRRRSRSVEHGVTRKLGAFSAPARLLAICAAMAAAFVWGVSGGMAQLRGGGDGALTLSLAHQAALFAFPALTPLVLIAVHQMHWRLMRPWLKRAARAVLCVWAAAALLMAYALL